MLKLILFFIYIFMLIAVIFLERKSPTEALLWVFVLLCLPYFGAILYLIFGSTMSIKITAFARKRRLKKQRPNLCPPQTNIVDPSNLSPVGSRVARFNCNYNQSRLTSYNRADLYTNGKEHYRQLFADIRSAKQCIYIEFYTIHHDEIGEALVSVLAEKASAGIEVLVLCDFIANLSTPQKMFQPLLDAGGKLVRVKPYFTHYRSHRKIVAIDHQIGYIGGMNIGRQYANMAKVKNPWRDTQIRLDGECVNVLDEYFLTDWLCAVRQIHWEQAVSYVSSITAKTFEATDKLCQFVVGGADTNKESVKMCYLSMISSAKKSIRIQTPYFIPDASILDALKAAAASGVEIELMIPGIKASFFLDPVTTYYCGQLLEYGAKVYKYRGYVHAKTMVVDDEICCIGSVNMDMRSLMVDDEVCGVFYSSPLVKQYIDIFKADIQNCDAYSWQRFLDRGRKEKALESFFVLFAPLM